jgi:drug/metabolite transporter (DMT)-like permease
MKTKLFLLILSSVSLSALAQIVLKFGMSSKQVHRALDESMSCLQTIWFVASNVYIMLGMLMYGTSAALWLLVLAKMDVSYVYPFVSLGFILTMLFGYLILGELISHWRVIGTILVIMGVMLVSYS